MKVDDYIYRLAYEIALFETMYNKSPSMIIMSSALASYMVSDMKMYFRRSDGPMGCFHGIPVTIYASDILECHLVEKTIHLD